MSFYELALLLPFILPLCSAQSTYYVTPTPDTPCPVTVDSCLSFVEHTSQGDGHLENATLVFLPGMHTIESSIGIRNLMSLTLLGNSSSLPQVTSSISCSQPARISFQYIENLFISALGIVSCGSEGQDFDGAAVVAKSVKNLMISNCLFQNNTNLDSFAGGGSIRIENSNATFIGNQFMNNQAVWGGGVALYYRSAGYFADNVFVNNIARFGGGGIDVFSFSTATFLNNTMMKNTATDGGAVLAEVVSSVTFNRNTFKDNRAIAMNGGGAAIQYSSTADFTDNDFINNSNWEVEIDPTSTATFFNNSFTGYAIYGSTNNTSSIYYIKPSPDTHTQCPESPCHTLSEYLRLADQYFTLNTTLVLLRGDHILEDTVLVRDISALTLIGGTVDSDSSRSNVATRIICSSMTVFFYFRSISEVNINAVSFVSCGNSNFPAMSFLALDHVSICNCTFQNSTGGAISVTQTDTLVLTYNSFIDNFSPAVGGGVYVDSVNNAHLFISNNFTGNHAGRSGGAMFIRNSFVQISGKTFFTANVGKLFGGAIAIVDSTMSYHGYTTFVSNTADSGGAVYAVQCHLKFEGENIFMNNTAYRDGGGLLLTSDSRFFLLPNTNISFVDNTAMKNGGAIKVDMANQFAYCRETFLTSQYLDECFFQFKSNSSIQDYKQLGDFNGTMHFNHNTAEEGGSDIYGGVVDNCWLQNVDITSSSVLEYVTGTGNTEVLNVSSDPLHIYICENNKPKYNSSSIKRQAYPGGKFSVSVIAMGLKNGSVSAVIQADPTQRIKFDSLQGLQNINKTCTDIEYTVFPLVKEAHENITLVTLYTQGPCLRKERSLELTVEVQQCPHGFELSEDMQVCVCGKKLEDITDNTCVIEDGTILRPDEASFWVDYSNEKSGLIFHPHCPFDYCISKKLYMSVDNSDMQCNYNRTGILCGECIQNLSLVFGSSRCLQCSDSHLALLVAFAFAGIALVFFLFLLKLTVAVGTINGLIFYANVVQVNSAVFFQPGTANILTVFIAWLNLDLGIETCFYDRMDAYAKTWLQFLFPIYVWTLVGIIILFSHFSQMISRLLGSNPIAVLCTLFLLSYAKVLRTIITVLSFARLEYPDGRQAVWLLDGNVKYLRDGHVPLFLVALSALLFLFLPYSLLLFCGQWLQGMPDSRVFSWINKPTIKSILDAYHAPYAGKHRYWTGLLLLTRSSLFLVYAFPLRDTDVNLFCITAATLVIIVIGFVAKKIHANQYLGALEASFIINLGVLAAATIAFGRLNALTYTSISIAFVTFIGIVVYHSHLQLKAYELVKKIANLTVDTFRRRKKYNLNVEDKDKELTTSTQSVVSLREPLLEDEV